MTQDEIIETANKAFDESSFTDAEVLRFAKLIAEKEREACIAHAMTSAEKAIDVAIKLEREACAKECWKQMGLLPTQAWTVNSYEQCINAIRARGQE